VSADDELVDVVVEFALGAELTAAGVERLLELAERAEQRGPFPGDEDG
jgi:regulator of RNase E activity RraB